MSYCDSVKGRDCGDGENGKVTFFDEGRCRKVGGEENRRKIDGKEV